QFLSQGVLRKLAAIFLYGGAEGGVGFHDKDQEFNGERQPFLDQRDPCGGEVLDRKDRKIAPPQRPQRHRQDQYSQQPKAEQEGEERSHNRAKRAQNKSKAEQLLRRECGTEAGSEEQPIQFG